MVGQRNTPEQLREKLSQLIRYEMESLPKASLGRIKSLNEETRRAEIETEPDGATIPNVPIAETFASDGGGDIRPLNPEHREGHVRGIVLYFHHTLDDHLVGGPVEHPNRDHEEENAIFLPAQIWYDSDDVPEHDPETRRIGHHDGGDLEIERESTRLAHQLGAAVELIGSPEPDLPPGPKAAEDYDEIVETGDALDEGETFVVDSANIQWPVAEESDESAARLIHPSGTGVTAVERGVAIEGEERVTAGRLTSGERQPLAGDYQHVHLIRHPDGEVSLTGPQLSFREFLAWMTDDGLREQLRNPDEYEEAMVYADSYLEWLEEQVGTGLDPTDERLWPDPEPMPEPEVRRGWVGLSIPVPGGVSVEAASFSTTVGGVSVYTQSDRGWGGAGWGENGWGGGSVRVRAEPATITTSTGPVGSTGWGRSYGDDYGSGSE